MNTLEITTLLATLPLFKDCTPKALSAICEHHAELLSLSSGDTLEECHAKKLGVLLQGEASICSADRGKSVILRSLHTGDVFGAAGLFCKSELPLSRITASTPCLVLLFSVDAVRTLLARDKGFLDAYLAFLANRVAFLNQKILCFTAGSAERRLALWLASQEQDRVTLPLSMTALSEMLDIGRASLYRALEKLEHDTLIAREGRTITLLDRQTLLQKYQ